MRKNTGQIPVNNFGGDSDIGVIIERYSFTDLLGPEGWGQPERHDRHSFFLLEQGKIKMEIDFEQQELQAPSVLYMHPDQVHRLIAFEAVTVSSWAINNENLHPEYLHLLEAITPVRSLQLDQENFSLMSDAVSLCIRFMDRKADKLYHALLKDSCNALTALYISLQTTGSKPSDKPARFEMVTRAFREVLEHHFMQLKRPVEYARMLHISTSYLNECVKSISGHSVSYHIQQRIVLEAKRLLYHSDQSVKEIAAILGYDDYPYFSRLFTKVTGMSALAFRKKNRV